MALVWFPLIQQVKIQGPACFGLSKDFQFRRSLFNKNCSYFMNLRDLSSQKTEMTT